MIEKCKIIILYQGNWCDRMKERCSPGINPVCPKDNTYCEWLVEYEDLPKEEK